MSVNAIDLWRWARKYAKRHEDAGEGTQYPTMREATRRFGCSMDGIESVLGDDLGGPDRYLGLAVAERCGSGVCHIEPRSAQRIEAY